MKPSKPSRRALASLVLAASFLVAPALAGCGGGDMEQLGAVAPPPPAPAAAAPAAAAPSGCLKDLDCKGDRVCEGGTCVAPH